MTSQLVVHSIDATLVVVPMRRALGTSALRVTEAPLLLLDLRTTEGILGRAYLFCYLAAAGRAARTLVAEANLAVAGHPASPLHIRHVLDRRFRLLGMRGIASMVAAGIDVACWDALAIEAGLPLGRLLGGELRPIQAYNSNGLGLVDASAAKDEALELVEGGFKGVKMRLGRANPLDDLDAVRAVRAVVPSEVALMADFNQALSLSEARERCSQLDDEGLYWIEEPLAHDDYEGSAELARTLNTPVQIGENFAGPRAMAQALSRTASDFVMPDMERIGGVTGWMSAASLADAARVPVSSHLFPEVSYHLLAATPTAHWLEYVDWADPILERPQRVVDGFIEPTKVPGNGLRWDQDAVRRFAVA